MNDFFNLLLFPEERHERGPDPGPYSDYRSYKPHLQREFRRKCVYCRVSDGLKGNEAFGVDHYIPKSTFENPRLADAWSNLFYACNVCNMWKGTSVSSPELFLPNPCTHRMAEHLQYQGADIKTYTQHGKWLAELLHLPERRDYRAFILSALFKFLEARGELLSELAFYEAKLEEAGEDTLSLEATIQEVTGELKKLDRHIEILTGEPVESRSS